MNRRLLVTALVVVMVAAGGYGLYRLGLYFGSQAAEAPAVATATNTAAAPQKAGEVDPATGKRVLYWHDPMVPGQKFDRPGKSPFMDMQLVPVYAESDANEGGVAISPRVQQNLGVRTAMVTQGALRATVEAVGSTAYNERDIAVVQARSNGYLERLYVRAPLDPVRQGQPLAELYVPDWVAAQEEYLSAKRIAAQAYGANAAGLVDAARQRMRLAGMNEEQIRRVEATGTVQARATLTAPISGVVAELSAREGMTVMAGAPLFRINGLATIWVNAEVPEAQAALVRPGNTVEARTVALPGATFTGKVSAILPEVNPGTRTLKARVELANPGGRLVPGMFVTVSFAPTAKSDVLFVPTEAVIATGRRSVVIVAQGDGKFLPVEVQTGMESDGRTEIRRGLAAGQNVVVSGQFLVDSEASLKGTATRMSDTVASSAAPAADATHSGEGRVEAIGKDEITLSHGPVPTLGWNAMTMTFRMPPAMAATKVAVGDRVRFEFHATRDGAYEIVSIVSQSGAVSHVESSAHGTIQDVGKGRPQETKP